MSNDYNYKRVLLKISGEALMGSKAYGIDTDTVKRFAQEIKAAHDKGLQIALVIGAGNIFRGLSSAASGICLLYTSPSPRDATLSRMPSSA